MSDTSKSDFVAVPRDRLLKLLDYSDADYVPNILFEEFRGYLGNPFVPQLGGSPEDLRNTLCGVLEHFGLDGAQKVTEYALKHRGVNAFDGSPAPQTNVSGVQALLNSLDRTAIAKIVDPSAWANDGGYDIEQTHSGPALIAADQIITYVLMTARALATTEGQP